MAVLADSEGGCVDVGENSNDTKKGCLLSLLLFCDLSNTKIW
jgi:hypothetical protein